MNQTDNFANRPALLEDEIDLRRYYRIIMRRKWAILGLAFSAALIAAMVVLAMRPIYSASTTLLIESQEAKAVSIEEVYGINSNAKEYYLTQFEILKSRDLAQQVIDQLDLRNHPEFDPDQQEKLIDFNWRQYIPLGPQEQKSAEQQEAEKQAAVLEQFTEQLTVSPVRNTQLVTVSFESYSPKLAADVANTIARVYINSHLEAKLQVTRQAADWLNERMQGLKQKLDESETKLQQYRDAEGLVDVSGVKTIGAKELDELTTRYVEARRERSKAENIYRQIGSLNNKSPEELMSIPAVLEHDLVHRLKEEESKAQREIANLSKRYGPKHPKMIAAKSTLQSAKDDLRSQVVSVVSGIEKEYRVAMGNEQDLQKQLQATKQEMGDINKKEFKLRELEREVQTNRKLYDLFFTRIQETNEGSGFESAHARVVDRAAAPTAPVKPKKVLLVMLTTLLTGLIGLALALLDEILDTTIKIPIDVQEKLRTPLLGVLPVAKGAKNNVGPYFGYKEDVQSAFAEAVRTIRTGLILSGIDQPHKITVITSTVPGEGKSTVSLNLTYALAQMERVLLIDADMRRPTVAKSFNLPAGCPGLSNLVAGTSPLENCIYEIDGLSVLPAGVVPSNPLELLSSKRFSEILHQLQANFDRVVIDSAPVQAVSDSLILGTLADSIVYVVKADSTPLQAVVSGIGRMTRSNLPLTGVVLNQIKPNSSEKGAHGDYYGGYYGYSSYAE